MTLRDLLAEDRVVFHANMAGIEQLKKLCEPIGGLEPYFNDYSKHLVLEIEGVGGFRKRHGVMIPTKYHGVHIYPLPSLSIGWVELPHYVELEHVEMKFPTAYLPGYDSMNPENSVVKGKPVRAEAHISFRYKENFYTVHLLAKSEYRRLEDEALQKHKESLKKQGQSEQ